MNYSKAVLQVLSASIFHHFRGKDNPPADEIFVPLAAIKEDKKDKNTLYATVRFIVNYCGRKEHSVRIKFQVDDRGRFLANTWSYV
jgi:hypothetical protein